MAVCIKKKIICEKVTVYYIRILESGRKYKDVSGEDFGFACGYALRETLGQRLSVNPGGDDECHASVF